MSIGIIFSRGRMKNRSPALLLMYTSGYKEFLENALQNLVDISLSGCEVRILTAFRDEQELLDLVKNISCLFLWTQKGRWMKYLDRRMRPIFTIHPALTS
jgi:hypothetical protein